MQVTPDTQSNIPHNNQINWITLFLEQSPAVIYVVDENKDFIFANNSVSKILNRSKEDIIGTNILEYVEHEVFPYLMLHIDEVFNLGRPIKTEEMLPLHDKETAFLCVKYPIRDRDGKIIACAGVGTDITEIKRKEEGLKEAVSLREEVLAVVSHDLRNPLNVIMMSAEMLERKTNPDSIFIHRQMHKIKQNALRMTGLIEDLLNLSKMEAGTFVLNPVNHCGNALIEETIENFHEISATKKIKLAKDIEKGNFCIRCDHNQMLRVFSNILNNALKFTPEGSTITLGSRKINATSIRYFIIDEGPGIDPEIQPKVFQKYWQAKGSAHKGTGLGLAIAKGIVEAHGGTIGLESKPGKGCKFYFDMPVG